MAGEVVRVLPAGLDVQVNPGESIMAAARRMGASWPSVCGGKAKCGVCVVKVLSGFEHIAPPTAMEQDALLTYRGVDHGRDPTLRLACQGTVQGPVTVRKLGVKLSPAAGANDTTVK